MLSTVFEVVDVDCQNGNNGGLEST